MTPIIEPVLPLKNAGLGFQKTYCHAGPKVPNVLIPHGIGASVFRFCLSVRAEKSSQKTRGDRVQKMGEQCRQYGWREPECVLFRTFKKKYIAD